MDGVAHRPSPDQYRIAVIGAGIAGMSAAWMLNQAHDVTLFEQDNRIGGHCNTVDVPGSSGPVAVDTGFIVYNELNYPNLTALFEHLGVATEPSDMSFAVSTDGGAFEYAGSLGGMLARQRNIVSPRFWSMMGDVRRFYRDAPGVLERPEFDNVSLGDYLDREGYSDAFVHDHILPMGAAIWSTPVAEMRNYPLSSFVRFYENHGLLKFRDRPVWRTVTGGSRSYVRRLTSAFAGSIRTRAGVRDVRRLESGVAVTDRTGTSYTFDRVVIAAHADQALGMLADPGADERRLLGAFRYARNVAVLHTDESLMPRRRGTWSSWNYIRESADPNGPVCVTYWMNRLQGVETERPVFVTLNPVHAPKATSVIATFEYEHPMFDTAAWSAQKQLWSLQGERNTWFCGSYFGAGFHEDALQAGLAAAEDLGGVRRPWRVAKESGRIFLGETASALDEEAA
jgi:predicted NAD/FAD-binding protein